MPETIATKRPTPTALAAARCSAAAWDKFYATALQESEDRARECKKSGDDYGWNFYKGQVSGLIHADIYMQSQQNTKSSGEHSSSAATNG